MRWLKFIRGRPKINPRKSLAELSLVVLTYNRPMLVQRLLRYLHSQAPGLSIVLVDHGDLESQESNAITAASFSPPVRHVRLPQEMQWVDILIRIADEFTSPYSAICPDDDIPVIEGIIEAVSMLSADSGMVCAQGYALSLRETESAMYFGPIEDFVPSYEDKAPLRRLFSMMRRYQPVFFGFYRTEVLAWSIREFAAAKIVNLMFQEFFHAALVCSRGAIGRCHSIHLWRRVTGSHTDRRTIHPFHQLIDNPGRLGADYLEFREKLVPYYIDNTQPGTSYSEADVQRLMDLVFVQYLVRHIDYGELDGKIRELLDDPSRDYFVSLPTQKDGIQERNFRRLRDIGEYTAEVLVDENLLKEAAQITNEIPRGAKNSTQERLISTEMLISAIKSALEYRSCI